MLDGQLQGVPGSWLVQSWMQVAAASAGVGATTDATAGSSRAAPRPARRRALRRESPPAGSRGETGVEKLRGRELVEGHSNRGLPLRAIEPVAEERAQVVEAPGAVRAPEDRCRGEVEAVRLVALEVVDDHLVRQVPHHEAGPACRWLHRFPLAPAPAREVRSSSST